MHPGDGYLVFGTSEKVNERAVQTPRLQLYMASPFFHWDFRGDALVGNTNAAAATPDPFDLTAQSLNPSPGGPPVFVQYSNTNPYWIALSGSSNPSSAPGLVILHEQHEVLLFARDPQEFAAAARSIDVAAPVCNISHYCGATSIPCASVGSTDDCTDINTIAARVLAEWRFAWESTRTPSVATLSYPPQLDWDVATPAPVAATLTPGDFWTDGETPAGPGAAPLDGTGSGHGSVKAAKVIDHGVCGVFQAYQNDQGTGLLQLIGNALPPFALHAVAEATNQNDTTCNNIEKRWLTMAPFLDLTTALPPFGYVQYKCVGDGCSCDTIGSFSNGKGNCTDSGGACATNAACCSDMCDIGNTYRCK